MRYEHNTDDDSLNMERNAGQVGEVLAVSVSLLSQKDDVELFSGHGITGLDLAIRSGLPLATLYDITERSLSTRIFGTSFDSAFGEPVPTLGQRDHAFIDLAGIAHVKENLFNANLFWMPLENLTFWGFPIYA
jgi:hypothetical protein